MSALNEDAGKNDHLVHAVNALESSFAGGMPLNLLSALAGSMSKDSRDPGGEAVSNLFVAVDEAGQLLQQGANVVGETVAAPLRGETPDYRDAARFVTRRLPIVGGVQAGVVRGIDSSKQSARAEKKRLNRSIYGRPEEFTR
jgi:hypothetical protein